MRTLLGRRQSSDESCALLQKRLPKPQMRCRLGLDWMPHGASEGSSPSAPQVRLTAGSVLMLCTHPCAAWLLAIWLGGKSKVPARPLVRKLQKTVSQRAGASPPHGPSVLSYQGRARLEDRDIIKYPP